MIPGIVAQAAPESALPDAVDDVIFLAKFDGTDGATAANDSSPVGATLTFYGTAALDTGEKQFGTASLQCLAVDDAVRAPANDLYTDIGAGDFTIEFFARPGNLDFPQTWIGVYTFNSAESRWRVVINGGFLTFQWQGLNQVWHTPLTAAHGMVEDTDFYHVAACRYRNVLRFFVGGVMVDKTLFADNFANDSTIGIATMLACDGSHGDEFRVTNGAWYRTDATFTPPATEFPTAPIEGTLAAIEGADLAAFEGPLIHEGTLAATEGADIAAFEGLGTIDGTLAATEGADIAAFSSVLPFQGALVKKAADHTAQNYNFTVVTWDAEEYDTDAIHDTGTNPSRLTIPAGLNGKYGVFRGTVHLSSVSASQTAALYIMRDNSASFDGWAGESHHNGAFGDVYLQFKTPPILLTTAEYYECVLYCSDTSITLENEESSFSLEVVG